MSTTTLAKKTNGSIESYLTGETFQAQVALALPKHLKPERFTRIALTAMRKTPKLLECTKESLLACLLDLSSLGIEPDGRRAHLIPYGKDCTLVIDYKGLVELMQRTGKVSRIHSDVVCENDVFRYDRGIVEVHAIDFRKPRGEVYAVYCIIGFKDGTEKAEVMTMEEVEAIRNRSSGYQAAIKYKKDSPWTTDFNEMAKKTVFRRASKWVTLSPEVQDVLAKEDAFERMERRAAGFEISTEDAAPPSKPERLTEPKPTDRIYELMKGIGWDEAGTMAFAAEEGICGEGKKIGDLDEATIKQVCILLEAQ